jgi:hypothetical protein
VVCWLNQMNLTSLISSTLTTASAYSAHIMSHITSHGTQKCRGLDPTQRPTPDAREVATFPDASDQHGVAYFVIGMGTWFDNLPGDNAVSVSHLCADIVYNTITTTQSEQQPASFSLTRWMLQGVADEPCNNAFHARASLVPNVGLPQRTSTCIRV